MVEILRRMVITGSKRSRNSIAALPFCLVLILSLPAMVPFAQPGYFRVHDALSHLFRTYELDSLLRQGVLLPRWFPDFVYGYGYPLLNFYAPLVYYVAESFHLLGLNFVDAAKATGGAGLLLAAAGMYALSVRWFGRTASILAALAYVYLPYGLFDLYFRWALPEFFAYALMPLALYTLDRALLGPDPRPEAENTVADKPYSWMVPHLRAVAPAAISMAGVTLSHHPSGLIFLPLATAYGLWIAIWIGTQADNSSRRTWRAMQATVRLALAVLLALGLAAFSWLPAWWEQCYVYIGGLAEGDPTFIGSLADPAELVQTSFLYDYSEPEGKFIQAGAVQMALTLFALPMLRRRGLARWRALFLFGMVLMFLFAMSKASAPIWRPLPLATLMSFPYRMQIFVGLGTALLTGAAVTSLSGRTRWVALPVAVLTIGLSSLANFNPPRLDISDFMVGRPWYIRWEMSGGFIGTTTPVQFLPRWVSLEPQDLSRPVRRASAESAYVPPEKLLLEAYSPTLMRLQIGTKEPALLLWRQFYFPGWSAYVNGLPAKLRPMGERGLIGLEMEPGEHQVELRWEATPIRSLGEILSIGALLVCGVALFKASHTPRYAAPLIAAIGCLIVAMALWPGAGAEPRAVNPTQIQYEGGLRLLGWQWNDAELARRGTLQISLFWYSQTRPAGDYLVSIRLLDRRGRVWASKRKAPFYGAAPTSWWQPGEIVRDSQDLYLPPDLVPGKYYLEVGVFDPERKKWLSAQSEQEHVRLGTVNVVRVPQAPVYHPQYIRGENLDDQVRLLGFDLSGGRPGKAYRVLPGESLTVTLYWSPLTHIQEDYSVFLHLSDAHSRNLAQADSYPPQDLRYTAAWEPGRYVRDTYELKIPPNAPPGLYWLSTGLYRRPELTRLPVVDSLGKVVSDRVVLTAVKVPGEQPPPPQHLTDADFDGLVRLIGYNLRHESGFKVLLRPGERLQLTLHWQASTAIDRDYTVFVHLVDAQGRLWAQQDNQPQRGTYPTSLWEPGEIVLDDYELILGPEIPPGEYRLEVGLYLLDSGERLRLVESGDGRIVLDSRVELDGR